MSLQTSTSVKKLLIVDDSKVSRMRIRAFFATQCPSWAIEEADSGDAALANAAAAAPDYVTMDVNMPGISGFEAAAQLMAAHPHIRIVMLTANIQESSRQQATSLQLNFVAKPATEASLQQALSHLVAS
jgi:two-component system chemotaxis response regulator CheY